MRIIIDGYNVMRSTGFSDDYDFKVLKNQREQFLKLLSVYAESSKYKIVAVFDGGGSGEVFGNTEAHGLVEVRYSAGGETADDVIKKIAAETQNPRDMMVVTSDKEISYYVRNCGTAVVSAVEFYSKIRPKQSVSGKEQTRAEFIEQYVKGFEDPRDERKNNNNFKGKKKRKNKW